MTEVERPSPPDERVLVTHAEGLAVGEAGPVCVVVWRTAPTRPLFDAQSAALTEAVLRHPDGAALLCVIEPTADPPSDELRKASTQMIASHGSRLKCVACAIEATGFGAAVTRSVLSGMAMLLPGRTTATAFLPTVKHSATWMRKHLSTVDVTTTEQVTDRLKARITALTATSTRRTAG
jgi:hypothetical protein